MQDILKGTIKKEEISAIVTSTAFQTSEEAFLAYYNGYWNNFDSVKVKITLDEIWSLICQPRLQVGMKEHRGHYAGQGIWLNTQTGEYSKNIAYTTKDHVLRLLTKGESMTNVAVYFVNLSTLTMEEAITMAKEIGNDKFTNRLLESYGLPQQIIN